MTETVYQGLRPFIPEGLKLGKDTRSVHFLLFPEVNEDYFDVEIERKVKRMQSVIELGRALREKHSLSLKVGKIFGSHHWKWRA
jgi:isoleucyl-tRNA synthetase